MRSWGTSFADFSVTCSCTTFPILKCKLISPNRTLFFVTPAHPLGHPERNIRFRPSTNSLSTHAPGPRWSLIVLLPLFLVHHPLFSLIFTVRGEATVPIFKTQLRSVFPGPPIYFTDFILGMVISYYHSRMGI